MADRWKRCRDCFEGSDAIKAASTLYLPVLEGWNQQGIEYQNYLKRAMFYPAFERTVAGMAGMVLRKPAAINAPPEVTDQADDLTLLHQALPDVAQVGLQEVLVTGRCGILVDWAANEQDLAASRPYWAIYPAESVINYRWSIDHGMPRLDLLVLQETIDAADPENPYQSKPTLQYREFVRTPSGVQAFIWQQRQSEGGGDTKFVRTGAENLKQGANPLTEIPFVLIGPRGLTPAIEKPPLLDLADLSLSHYRTSADLEHGRHFTALPTPWITGWQQTGGPMKIGSGEAWIIPSADAKVGMLEFTGQGLGALEKALDQKEKAMAVVGARMLEQQAREREAAETVRLRHSGEHAVLASIAHAVSLGLTVAMRYHAAWLGTTDKQALDQIEVALNTDFFENRLSAQEVTALVQAWQAGSISGETLYWNLQRGEWARPTVTWEQEQQEIDAGEGGQDDAATIAAATAAALADQIARPKPPPGTPDRELAPVPPEDASLAETD
jgi:hypothetical protein